MSTEEMKEKIVKDEEPKEIPVEEKQKGKVQEYIEKKKIEEQQVEDAENEKRNSNKGKDGEHVKNVLQTASTVATAIPHFVSFGLGAGLGAGGKSIVQRLIEELKDR